MRKSINFYKHDTTIATVPKTAASATSAPIIKRRTRLTSSIATSWLSRSIRPSRVSFSVWMWMT